MNDVEIKCEQGSFNKARNVFRALKNPGQVLSFVFSRDQLVDSRGRVQLPSWFADHLRTGLWATRMVFEASHAASQSNMGQCAATDFIAVARGQVEFHLAVHSAVTAQDIHDDEK